MEDWDGREIFHCTNDLLNKIFEYDYIIKTTNILKAECLISNPNLFQLSLYL